MCYLFKKVILVIFLSFPIIALSNECPDDPNYKYYRGHRSVHFSDYLDLSIASNVRVCIDSSVTSFWKMVTRDAINSLNLSISTTNSILNFSESTSNCTFYVRMDYSMNDSRYAEINEPVIPGYTSVLINGNRKTISSRYLAEHIIMHELLHTIGLGHTGNNVWYEIPNTDGFYDTKNAGRSIMCKYADDDSTFPQRYLNFLDKRSLEIMYPK